MFTAREYTSAVVMSSLLTSLAWLTLIVATLAVIWGMGQ